MTIATETARAAQLLIDQANTAAKSLITGVFNVQGYGAEGDGITDDTAAIQAAINAAGNGPAIIYFPYGDYLVTSTLVIAASAYLTFQGVGSYLYGRSILRKKFNGSLIVLNNQKGFAVRDMDWFGHNDSGYPTGFAIDATQTVLELRNCSFNYFESGLKISKGWYSKLEDVACVYNTNYGLWVNGEGHNLNILHGRYSSNGQHGIFYDGTLGGSFGVKITGALAELNGGTGLALLGVEAFHVDGFYSENNGIPVDVAGAVGTGVFSGCYFNGKDQFQLANCSHSGTVIFQGCFFNSVRTAGPTTYGIRTLSATTRVLSLMNKFNNVTVEVGGTVGEFQVGSRMHLGFYRDDVVASLTNSQISRGAGAVKEYVMPTAGCIRGLGIIASAVPTTGTLTAKVYVNGVDQVVSLVLSNATGARTASMQPNNMKKFLAGNYISVVISTTADWAPVTNDVAVDVIVEV